MAQRNGRRMIGHGGSINGFNAWLNTFPNDELTIVLLTNTNGASKATSPQLVDAVFAAAQGQGCRRRVRRYHLRRHDRGWQWASRTERLALGSIANGSSSLDVSLAVAQQPGDHFASGHLQILDRSSATGGRLIGLA